MTLGKPFSYSAGALVSFSTKWKQEQLRISLNEIAGKHPAESLATSWCLSCLFLHPLPPPHPTPPLHRSSWKPG